MRKTILVTGGTGSLGRVLVPRLVEAGHDVRVASRSREPATGSRPYTWATVDYRSGTGLDEAFTEVGTVIHCATAFGSGAERRLARAVVDAARRHGAPHLVHISIVGVDRIPFSYYKGKLATEHVIEDSGLPWTILRATQFHSLILDLLRRLAALPVVLVPAGIRTQPVDIREVAGRLVELALGEPAARVADLAGPRIWSFRELVDVYLAARNTRRPVVGVRIPGAAGRGFRAGLNLAPDRAVGRLGFEEYLAEQNLLGDRARRR